MRNLHKFAVRALVTSMALAMFTTVEAQSAPIAAATSLNISIPAQPLSSALIAFSQQTHVQVLNAAPKLKLEGVRSAGVTGQYTAAQALAMLLAGTGFAGRFIDTGTVVINASAPSSGHSAAHPGKNAAKQADSHPAEVENLSKITVLGSLIPRSQIETSSPLITITAEEIKQQGYTSVADALQHATVNTGAVNNTATNTGDLWAAKTLSLFGLNASYIKFLVDGRPMPSFSSPEENNVVGTNELDANLNSIPLDMVQAIEILPGGQSSLYGSDAIAGVVNIVLKKHVDYATLDTSYGWYDDGGGASHKISMTDSFHVGKLDLLVGAQFNNSQPIWAYQRPLTAQNFAGGLTPQQPQTDVGLFGILTGNEYFFDPSQCGKLAGLWHGTLKFYANPMGGGSCGTPYSSSLGSTLTNQDKSSSVSAHATYYVNNDFRFYADLLDTYEEQAHTSFQGVTTQFFDPNLQDVVFLERNFAPEEVGGDQNLLSERSYENTYTATLGGAGSFGDHWDYDVGLTAGGESLDDRQSGPYSLASTPNSYLAQVLGPQLGSYSLGLATYPVYSPNYGLLYTPLTPSQYAAISGAASTASTTIDDTLRGQLTDSSLFALPGGDAGLALVAEGGYQYWKFAPAEALQTGEVGYALDTPSMGHRDRWATAAEFNLPLFKMLTLDASARYDRYTAQDNDFGHLTYSFGLEFRPVQSLLLRGKYGTAFKAPSLVDEFEGLNSYETADIDYANCAKLGYAGANAGNCPYPYSQSAFRAQGTPSGNLKPITSTSWSYGLVWSPSASLSMSLDYQHLDIRNEVLVENYDQLLMQEAACLAGSLDISSPTCVAALNQVIRGPAAPGSSLLGPIEEVLFRKINLARELNNSINASLNYRQDLGAYGRLVYRAAYTDVLAHEQQTFPNDPVLNLLTEPLYSTEFKTRANASLGWENSRWNVTLTAIRDGSTPNYAAQLDNGYALPGDGRLPPWITYNASINWIAVPGLTLSFVVNNLRNSMPPVDRTQPGTTNLPYNVGNYDPYGRSYLLEAKYQFGHPL